MTFALYIAAALLLLLGVAHSYLGERYILIRLLRSEGFATLFRNSEFIGRTLRFAWHLTSVAWLGLAAVLIVLADPPLSRTVLGAIVALTFLIHGVVALIASRGRHLAWPVFLAVAALVLFATRA